MDRLTSIGGYSSRRSPSHLVPLSCSPTRSVNWMTFSSHPSSGPTQVVPSSDQSPPHEFWLQGDSVLCACPDCAAPMSIRLWLMVADCWQCGTSVELTEQQEREIQALLREQPDLDSPSSRPPTTIHRGQESRSTTAPGLLPPPRPCAVPQPDTTAHQGSPQPVSMRWEWGEWLKQIPAWLISLLFHMALLALLAMLILEDGVEDPYITLSTEANRWRYEARAGR